MKTKEFQVVEVRDKYHKYVIYTGTFQNCVKETERFLKYQREEVEKRPEFMHEFRNRDNHPFNYEIQTIL